MFDQVTHWESADVYTRLSDAQILAHFTVESPWEAKSPPLTIGPPPFEKNPVNFVYLSIRELNYLGYLAVVRFLTKIKSSCKRQIFCDDYHWHLLSYETYHYQYNNLVNFNFLSEIRTSNKVKQRGTNFIRTLINRYVIKPISYSPYGMGRGDTVILIKKKIDLDFFEKYTNVLTGVDCISEK